MSDTMSQENVTSFPQNEDEQGEVQGSGDGTQDVGGVAGKRLLSFIERIERLEEEKQALAEDIKEVYGEAKGVGFDVKAMRKLIKLKNMDAEKRQEEEAVLDLYKAAIGII